MALSLFSFGETECDLHKNGKAFPLKKQPKGRNRVRPSQEGEGCSPHQKETTMATTNRDDARNNSRMTAALLIIPYLGLFFLVWKQNDSLMGASLLSISSSTAYNPALSIQQDLSWRKLSPNVLVNNESLSSVNNNNSGWDPSNPLGIPQGEAQALPSIRVSDAESAVNERKFYGGAGDKPHLGGFTEFDTDGVSPKVWTHMITQYGVKSVLDIGCGRGTSTTWFLYHGVRALCVEGSHDAVEKTLLPDPERQLVEHDFSRGPYWPADTYDAAWAVEFLEHVGVNYHFNYVSAFRKAALLFVTSSRWGGWHHVEVHDDPWWIRKYESYGFRYSKELTDELRQLARFENGIGPTGKRFRAGHISLSMKVFINPAVAALPQHAHLFPEVGCYVNRENRKLIQRECGVGKNAGLESKLPDSFKPLQLTEEMDQKWMDMLLAKLDMEKLKNLV